MTIEIMMFKGHEVRKVVDEFYLSQASQSRARDDDDFFLAFQDEKLLGCARFCNEEQVAMLRTMMVEKSARRMKVGTALLSKFEEYLEKNEIKNTYCLPYSHLENFYAQAGFRKLDERSIPNFLKMRLEQYRNQGLDCICMGRLK